MREPYPDRGSERVAVPVAWGPSSDDASRAISRRWRERGDLEGEQHVIEIHDDGSEGADRKSVV